MKSLATTLYRTNWEDYSKDTILAAKYVLLDTIAAMVAGIQQKESKQLLKSLEEDDSGTYHILGTRESTTLYNTALLHGAASVVTEMDEGNQYSKGHPAAHVVPAMLTYVQKKNEYSGQQFLSTLIKAYEACSRFGRATTLRPEAHAHGTWGIMGAAAATLLLEDVTKEEFEKGIQLSATFALPTLWNAALEGALVRNIYAGHAIEMGIKTLALLKSGHMAPTKNIEYVFSTVIGSNFDESSLVRSDDDLWDIEQNYFKPYAFCRYAHAPIDAFGAVIKKHQLSPSKISKVNVHTYSRAATLKNKDYTNILSAKFSIPYALSIWLKTEKVDQTIFTDELLHDLEIRDFASKVDVVTSSELEKDYPKVMPAVVEVIDTSGNTYTERIDIAKGGPNQKLTTIDLEEKFCRLTDGVYIKQQQKEIINWILNMEEKKDINELITLCRAIEK
ncbi:MmgE/PrpD family protein [Anaerobacillus sp. MEB173]|uniref:MmgE/PrpD family protein n=1 Tax=Anaerobacillus sp. MEB173 TaxID=3383345 RepID=UPI003F900D55